MQGGCTESSGQVVRRKGEARRPVGHPGPPSPHGQLERSFGGLRLSGEGPGWTRRPPAGRGPGRGRGVGSCIGRVLGVAPVGRVLGVAPTRASPGPRLHPVGGRRQPGPGQGCGHGGGT